MTCVDATVRSDNVEDVRRAWAGIVKGPLPQGLMASRLLREREIDRWRIESLWRDAEAIDAMRASGRTPAAIAVFEAAGTKPELTLWNVEGTLECAKA